MKERFTIEQGKVLLAFIEASKGCESVTGVEKGVPKRALCIKEHFPEEYEVVKVLPKEELKKKFYERFHEYFRE